MTRRKLAISRTPPRPRAILDAAARLVGCSLSSLGDVEQLAGVDPRSDAERTALWAQYRHLFDGPAEVLFAAVMDHCSAIALDRIARGELCLLPTMGARHAQRIISS